ncbi:MAG: hypothetical protein ACI9VT_003569 [Psychroserpens sp.]|jgi:hypothetical protein
MNEYTAAYEVFMSQADSANELWKFYSAVCLAVLGATIGSDKFKSSRKNTLIIIGAFLLFSLGNLLALMQVQEMVFALSEITNSLSKTTPFSTLVLKANTVCEITVFHIACDFALSCAIYIVSRKSWSPSS